MKLRSALLAVMVAVLLGGCKDDKSTPPQPKTEAALPASPAPALQPVAATEPAADTAKLGIANPASVNCAKVGGKTVIRKDASGGERGYCVFTDGSECDEWALFRGACKAGDSKKPALSTPKRDPFTRP
jgi:putative hemolysin